MLITGLTVAESDKAYKQAEHQCGRAAVKIALRQEQDSPPALAYGNTWFSEKDGKQYWPDRERARCKSCHRKLAVRR